MWTPVLPDQLAELPVEQLATSTTPDRWHGALQSMGTHCRDGGWVVSGQRNVSIALASTALSVVPAGGQPAAGSAAALLRLMARFSDGADHRRRRALVTGMLPPVPDVVTAAGARANDYLLLRRGSAFDIMPMARQLPAEVLARGLGLERAEVERAVVLTGTLCDAMTPLSAPRSVPAGRADAAAAELTGLLRRCLRTSDNERVAAAISILFQARDATAALIGTAVLAGSDTRTDPRSPGQRVEHVLRHEAPVQCTRRSAVTDVLIGDVTIPSGAAVWVFVATAERGSAMPATFGTGPHGCPGAAHATAIARQVVTVMDAEGWRPVPGQRVDYEPRPNIRVPVRVLVARS